MKLSEYKKIKLPDKPGVYFFLGPPKLRRSVGDKNGNPPSRQATVRQREILYIGKATSLRDRTRSYFSKDLINTRGPAILDMVVQAREIDWQVTDSVLEALILEAELIKKYQPKYNVKEKDDKSWNYVCITREEIPKVLIKRGKELEEGKNFFETAPSETRGQGTHSFLKNPCPPLAKCFGPFVNGSQLKEAMKIIRRIFPYIDGDSIKKNNKEFYKQLGLMPETIYEYKNNIKNLVLFFQGKKKKIVQNLKREMMQYAKRKEFEKAGEVKKRIFALNHINDVALIKDEKSIFIGSLSPRARGAFILGPSACERPSKNNFSSFISRIEAYDVAHMSGKNMVGVMTVLENSTPVKSEYKKFIIRTVGKANDTGALEEMLSRRFRHTEWGFPSLVVVDGSIAQINVAKRVLNRYQIKIPIVSVVKDEKHKAKAIKGDEDIIKKHKKNILLVNNEAHRFAITFYRQKSRKNMLK